jgi:hypothetical protein
MKWDYKKKLYEAIYMLVAPTEINNNCVSIKTNITIPKFVFKIISLKFQNATGQQNLSIR